MGGALVANSFSGKILAMVKDNNIKCFVYSFMRIDKDKKYSLDDLKSNFQLINIVGD